MNRLLLPLSFLGLAICPACQSANEDRDFFADTQAVALNQTIEVQAANGARADAMLHESHFDGAQLNTLGAAKVLAMLRSDTPLPVTIYMNVDSLQKERQKSVETFLKDSAVAARDYRIEQGPNPAATASSAKAIEALPATSSNTTAQTGAATPAAPAGFGASPQPPMK